MSEEKSVHLTGLAIKVAVKCPRCESKTPVVGLHRSIECHGCAHPISIPWSKCLPSADSVYSLIGGWQHFSRKGTGDGSHITEMELGAPKCSCGNRLPSRPEELEAAAGAGAFNCSKCSANIPVRRSPENGLTISSSFPPIHYLVDAPQARAQPKAAVETIDCAHCGAPLRANGAGRMVQCEYCGSSQKLDANLWRKFNPTPPLRAFHLFVAADRLKVLEKTFLHSDRALKAAGNPQTTADELRVLAKSSDLEVRRAVADHPNTPDDALILLVRKDGARYGEVLLERYERDGGSAELDAALAPVRVTREERLAKEAAEAARQAQHDAHMARVARESAERQRLEDEKRARREAEAAAERERQAQIAKLKQGVNTVGDWITRLVIAVIVLGILGVGAFVWYVDSTSPVAPTQKRPTLPEPRRLK